MSLSSRVRVYMACSLDGFIAGPNDDLSFLHPEAPPPGDATTDPPAEPAPTEPEPTGALEFEAFMSQVGAMLMGRRTHDVIAGMGVWPYGETPVLVATHRTLPAAAETVQAVQGDITSLIEQAKAAAGDKDVYLDGGILIRQALDAGLVDELCITFVPILLGGEGVRLFDGLLAQTRLVFTEHHRLGTMVQMTAQVKPAGG
jgi:dihydrofolate reductase